MTTALTLLTRVAYLDREIASPQLRRLLALLAHDLRAGASTGRLVAGLWPEAQPAHPAKALQVLVSRARAQLGHDTILSTPGGYRLSLRAEQVDVTAAASAARLATQAWQRGEATAALDMAERGLQLWAPDPDHPGGPGTTDQSSGPGTTDRSGGPGTADGAPVRDHADGTVRSQPGNAHFRGHADLPGHVDFAGHADLPGPATSARYAFESAEAEDPLTVVRRDAALPHTTLRRIHALAQAQLGQHDSAHPALLSLVAEHPRDEDLLAALLRTECALVGSAAALERYERYRRDLRDQLGTDPGAALQQVHRELLNHDAPPVRGGIAHEPNALLGRDEDVAAVAALVRTARVTSIVGPGGLGKTRLANAVSLLAQQRVVQLVGLTGVTSDSGVAAEVAATLGVRDARLRATTAHLTPRSDVVSGIVGALGPRPSLLVLDNCEHVLDGVATLVQSLVALSPDVRVLTTSRAPLGVTSESVYLLPELDLPTSVDLFTQRARAARPDIDLPADAVQRLCQHLDGLPLAVELAAARTRVMSVAEIERRLFDRFALLRGSARDAPARHRTLEAVIDWSWNLLDSQQQEALATLALFQDGFTLDAAAQVLGPQLDALTLLEQLVDQSLLKVAETPLGSRFRMLETVREFGAVQLQRSGRAEQATAALHAWAQDFAGREALRMFDRDQLAAVNVVRAEQDNLVNILSLALARGDVATAGGVYAALAGLWLIESNHTRAMAYVADIAWLLSHADDDPATREVRRAALLLCIANTLVLADASALRSLLALRRLPPAEEATTLSTLAEVIARLPDIDTTQADVLRQLVDDPDPMVAVTTATIASQLWENDGLVQDALAVTRMALSRMPQDANLWSIAATRGRLAELCNHVGRYAEAVTEAQRALPGLEQLGAWFDVMQLRWGLVLSHLNLGDLDQAASWLQAATSIEVDDLYGFRMLDIGVRGELDLQRGDIDAGLGKWRLAAERVAAGVAGLPTSTPPGLEPWTMATQSLALVAHVRHGAASVVPGLVDLLRSKLQTLLTAPGQPSSPFLDLPVCGLAMLGLGLHALDGERPEVGARLVALAEAFGYPRAHPSTAGSYAAGLARGRAPSAYDDAVSSYADLDRAGLVQVARDLIQT